jgi:5'-3' exonuclease
MGIAFVVAPYEADAQLAYMYDSNLIDFVITEDSDLLVYGVNKVFFKMDLAGKGFEIDLEFLE